MKVPESARTAPRQLENSTVETAPVASVDHDADGLAFLALSSIKGVGYWTLRRLAERQIRFAEVMACDDQEEVTNTLRAVGAKVTGGMVRQWHDAREGALERGAHLSAKLAAEDIRILFRGDPGFPTCFDELKDPVYWLFVHGNPAVLARDAIGVVGTREPSDDGLWLGRFVGACLSEWGAATVSGLAAGIDQLVHRMSLRMALPTVAVLGTGILSEYPKGSAELRNQIVAAGGAIVTEYLPRDEYSRENFVRRNRLQAALSRVLIPVEWAARSGTAHTVRFAADLGRSIACLRMPDWDEMRTPFRTIQSESTELFTIPGDEAAFRDFVAQRLTCIPQRRTSQYSLFD